MPNKIITPLSLIGSIVTLATFAGILFAVDSRYQTAEAADKKASEQLQSQQTERTETDLDLLLLELEFLKSLKQDAVDHDHGQDEIDDLDKKIEYLEKKQLILEE